MQISHTEMRKLQHAVVLADCSSYVEAARLLGLSQPALSRSIQSLEQSIGFRLFERSRAGLNMTEAGAFYIENARGLMHDFANLQSLASELACGEAGEIAIGLAPFAASLFLPGVLLDFMHRRPEVSVTMSVQPANQLLQSLLDEDLSFFVGASALIPNNPSVTSAALVNVEPCLLVRPEHPLAGKEKLTSEEVRQFPSLSETVSFPRLRPAAYLGRASIQCSDLATVKTVVESTDTIWVAGRLGARTSGHGGPFVELPWPVDRELAGSALKIYRLARRRPSQLSLLLEDMLRASVETLAPAAASSRLSG